MEPVYLLTYLPKQQALNPMGSHQKDQTGVCLSSTYHVWEGLSNAGQGGTIGMYILVEDESRTYLYRGTVLEDGTLVEYSARVHGGASSTCQHLGALQLAEGYPHDASTC